MDNRNLNISLLYHSPKHVLHLTIHITVHICNIQRTSPTDSDAFLWNRSFIFTQCQTNVFYCFGEKKLNKKLQTLQYCKLSQWCRKRAWVSWSQPNVSELSFRAILHSATSPQGDCGCHSAELECFLINFTATVCVWGAVCFMEHSISLCAVSS